MKLSKQERIISVVKFIYKHWKPDHCKSIALLLVTSGLVKLSDSLFRDIVTIVLKIQLPSSQIGSDDTNGVFLISMGITFMLIYEARKTGRDTDSRILSWLAYFGAMFFTLYTVISN